MRMEAKNKIRKRGWDKDGDIGDDEDEGGGSNAIEIINQLEAEELRKNIKIQLSHKKKALGELKGKIEKPESIEEHLELHPFSSSTNL